VWAGCVENTGLSIKENLDLVVYFGKKTKKVHKYAKKEQVFDTKTEEECLGLKTTKITQNMFK